MAPILGRHSEEQVRPSVCRSAPANDVFSTLVSKESAGPRPTPLSPRSRPDRSLTAHRRTLLSSSGNWRKLVSGSSDVVVLQFIFGTPVDEFSTHRRIKNKRSVVCPRKEIQKSWVRGHNEERKT
ncbi:hypothetical protein F2P81_022497 [Scophthalmus maximus]|uniref:Uncharacterized protein n=1 Tax=Scophthalmus maximus TaxID=52904 RepID=A0A6A4RSH3_SCOMX|nr:hypothetical protein F2P81_022497 [Scophthalmus maximus]